MSSYQFVNTLAQCYAEQTGQGGVTGGGSQNPQDYYNMNYPNCYSPNLAAAAQQQYGQYSQLMMGGNNGSGGGAGGQVGVSPGGGMGGADFGTNATTTANTNAANTSTGQRGSANQSPSSSGLMPNSTNNAVGGGGGSNSSNKFASSAATGSGLVGQAPVGSVLDGSLGSPQDLSRASDGETPQPSCQSMGGPKTPDSGPPLSPALTASSPGSTSKGHPESSSDRGGGGSSGGGGGGGSGSSKNGSSKSSSNSNGKDPPHIYPWMKRVHLGQSKFRFL